MPSAKPENRILTPPPACPFCGDDGPLVRVHGHDQCRRCGAVVNRCCDD